MWTRSALQYKVKLTDTFLRCLLSNLCYKFLSMPFKNLWIKLGYDPRKDPSSKCYQSIDYRVPQDLLVMVPDTGRQKAYRGLESGNALSLHIKYIYPPSHITHFFSHTLTHHTHTLIGSQISVDKGATKESGLDETSFTFLQNKWPSQRQLTYQLCDIQDSDVQEIIRANDDREPHFKVKCEGV